MSLFSRTPYHPGIHPGEDLQNNPGALRLDGVRSRAIETSRTRLLVTALVFLAIFGIIGGRMIDVAVLDANPAKPRALPQARTQGLEMGRADITDRDGAVLATSLPTVSLYARPQDMIEARVDVAEAAKKLAAALPDMDADDVRARIQGAKTFVYLRRNLTPRQQYDVNALGIPGLHFEKGERRVYPHGNLVAHVVGMTDIDNKGIAGIERFFDGRLTEDSAPLALSLDVGVQNVVRTELQKSVQQFNALGATGMVADVQTGEMLAMVSLPDFDPNDPPAGTNEAMFNRATKGAYEMGSTFKLFNTAMALESGRVNINSSFDATKPLKFGSHTIHDDHAQNRWMSVPEILIHSSNIGSARMALEAGSDFQRRFMGRLGMLDSPSLELPEVGAPQVPSPWREINTITISFGHGLSVTPAQLMAGTVALVNGGVFHPLTLIHRADGAPVPGEIVLKQKTSAHMRNLMRMVVTEGTGKKADVPGYEVGGKTGTAEKAAHGGYRKKAVLSSFVAAFPMDNPRYVVIAMIDEPQGTKETYGYITAGWTAAPAAGRIIAQIAPMLGIAPKALPEASAAAKPLPSKGGDLAQSR
ncbi:peptidoglycan D,D-transpeptidase FtsI family protein [Magnetospirillum gryphiswaldense]|uniref:Cell division protein FtsI/penicillin-binding protein 2 n=1 Tax=Magnetospirillum gryphiswaldense TaxID=55518 RepID=A4TTZ8_9PROT|nr:penicillin-binding protein 2 [Magnetospirillum gryphiswaldense]AVM76280.1 Peptidoglycan synthase FtsI [Magnetospirillum gryphiswaldense MSR-1]AVM80183.1 Peptidoglycan synthase FtsI [Magnetospirillum gryphiswaldense]CAM74105.1 Cell division protein FtsI/penicillin-binding protein 2 [Magnetospirillum gryphiswaldense MSR-1]